MIVLDKNAQWTDYRPTDATKKVMRDNLEYLIHQLPDKELEHKYYQFVSSFCRKEYDSVHIGYIGGYKGLFLIVPISIEGDRKIKFGCKLSEAPCHYKTELDIAKVFVEFVYLENLLAEALADLANEKELSRLVNFVARKAECSTEEAKNAVGRYLVFVHTSIYPFLSGKTASIQAKV